MTDVAVRDCPVCLSAGAVVGTRCQLCDAEFAEPPDDEPPRVVERPVGGAAGLPPVAPPILRLSDVVDELRRLATSVAGATEPRALVEACARLERMAETLRRQFLDDVVAGYPTPRGRVAAS
jgi:hypothetical protein